MRRRSPARRDGARHSWVASTLPASGVLPVSSPVEPESGVARPASGLGAAQVLGNVMNPPTRAARGDA
jgi:hypothetical protein